MPRPARNLLDDQRVKMLIVAVKLRATLRQNNIVLDGRRDAR